jgi:hypothetical protein
VLNKNPKERPAIAEVVAMPFIQNNISKFISCKGRIRPDIIPLKRTKFHA